MLAQKDAYNTTKDSCDVEGLDTTMGYSAWVGSKAKNDGVMIASCKQTPSIGRLYLISHFSTSCRSNSIRENQSGSYTYDGRNR